MRWRPSSTSADSVAWTGVRRPGPRWQTAPVGGAVVMVILLVVIMPVGILLSGAAVAALLGGLLKRDVDDTHRGSELLDLSESNPWADNGAGE